MRISIEKNLMVPMRDGVRLATDVYRPDELGPFPTLLTRLPYNKDGQFGYFDVLRAVQAGYVVVIQDTRGRWASDGEFNPFFDEARDGADAIAWAAAQPWSTGAVGMIGGSYYGATQWTAATQAPEALRAIAPFVTTDQYYDGWAYQGGAFQLGFNLHWTLMALASAEVTRRMAAGTAGPADFAALVAALDDNDATFRRLPLLGLPELAGLAPYYDDWLRHPSYDDYWRATAPRESCGQITVPALNVGGWYDLFLKGTLANYTGMRAPAPRERPSRRRLRRQAPPRHRLPRPQAHSVPACSRATGVTLAMVRLAAAGSLRQAITRSRRPGVIARRRRVGDRAEVMPMAFSRQWVVDTLRHLGYQEAADEASRVLPEEVEREELERFGDQHGITRGELMNRLGGSP